ncbi:MAG TPA: 50S ribosomal protein L7/L12 [Anaerolineae bacterium]|nr:50S ribosomal protein L7/L12 [Anaerolineae bacterium]
MTKEEMLAAIEQMTVLELSDLVKALEEKFGVSAAMPMAVAGPMPTASAGPVEEAEEKVEWDVELKDFGAKKIQVIKAVRGLTELGLREAKEMVEGVPVTILSGVSKEIAEDARQKLEAEGATVELK